MLSWHAVGILPIWALGNEGPSCGHGRFPPVQDNVIAVGATDVDNEIYVFSSRGPGHFNGSTVLKPELSAPGVEVRSAYNNADNGYAFLTGTSMACPHVAGIAAVLVGIKENLTFQELKDFLTLHTTIGLEPTGDNCEGTGDDDWPNNSFGYGLANALNSVNALIRMEV